MNKDEAKNLVVKTFEQSFDESRFLFFIKNLLNELDESKSQVWAGNYIPESYRGAIKSYKRIGQYTDKNKNAIDVLIVNVKRDNTLERARTLQRNFIARHLKQRNHEAALVAFYTEDSEDWRFSLVIMELNLTKTKVEIELSPAKRYSFLVGVNERSHTAQNQFVNLLSDKKDRHTLQEIEEAFNIETVTKEFFLEYRDLFIRTKKSLDKIVSVDPKVKNEFEMKGVDSVNFAKKLLGQIVFLYFLQKKGWFGVARDEQWGEGSKKFLRELLEGKHGKFDNFFNDILEPLFYEALRIDRSHDDHYYSRFNCKIPFLNGGLFDPIGKDGGYDWVKTDITLPNELFSNTKKTTTGDIGDGILDIFDRYNFTVIEDEPLEKEVAIDPELLGKAYEKFNAIRPDNFDEYLKVLKSGKKGEETKFNKQYGVYYTPREIVHYMCRESLINYLASKFADKSDAYKKIDLEQLDAFGNTTRKGQLQLEVEYKSVPHIPKTDIETLINYGELFGENEAVVEAKGKETDTYYYKLPENIRTNAELIDAQLSNILICDPAIGSGAFPVGMMHEIISTRNLLTIFIEDENRSKYLFKRECIEKSLFGADIDSGAVEIAKLRLWLSLVVDEDDINNIKPLPNLDYKIVCGNSLLGVSKNIFNNELFEQLELLKPFHFNETNPSKKLEYKNQIDELILNITSGLKDFDLEVYFSEVFHSKNGFDCIIGNPPWSSKINDLQKKIVSKKYGLPSKNLNIFAPFLLLAMRLINLNGQVCLLIPKVFIKNSSYQSIRENIINNFSLVNLIDFGKFPNVASDCVSPLISHKKEIETNITVFQREQIKKGSVSQNIFSKNPICAFSFDIDDTKVNLLSKIESNSIKLYPNIAKIKRGIELGQKSLVAKCNNCKNWNEVGEKYYNEKEKLCRWCGNILPKESTVCISSKSKDDRYTSPCLSGKEIDFYEVKEGYYIIENLKGIDYKKAIATGDRIYIKRIATHPIGVYLRIDQDYLAFNTVYSIYRSKYDLRFLMGILNSSLMSFYYENTYNLGMNLTTQITIEYLRELPIINLSNSNDIEHIYNYLINSVDKIQNHINSKNRTLNVESLNKQINISVYKIYNLTYEEVKIIDPEIEKIISEKEYEKF